MLASAITQGDELTTMLLLEKTAIMFLLEPMPANTVKALVMFLLAITLEIEFMLGLIIHVLEQMLTLAQLQRIIEFRLAIVPIINMTTVVCLVALAVVIILEKYL